MKTDTTKPAETGWGVFSNYPASGYKHVIPLEDIKPHERTVRCWCRPTRDEEDRNCVVHHAMDQREKYERGERKIS